MMKKIYHFSPEERFLEIIQDGQIITEREVMNKNLKFFNHYVMDINEKRNLLSYYEILKSSYKLLGSYVWFTEQPKSVATATGNDMRFEFDANEIGAIHWSEVMKNLTKRKQKRHLKSLMDIAIAKGDNPQDWWVTRQSVSLEKCVDYQKMGNIKKWGLIA